LGGGVRGERGGGAGKGGRAGGWRRGGGGGETPPGRGGGEGGPAGMWSSVDLPQRVGPTIATNSRSGTASEARSTAVKVASCASPKDPVTSASPTART